MPRVQRTGKWYKPGYTNTLSCILTGQNEPEKGEIVLAALQKLKEQIEPLGCVVKEVPPEYAGDCSRPLSALADNLKCSSLAAAPAAHVTADWGRTSFTGMTQAIEEDKERPALDENEDEFSEDGSPAYAAPAPAKSALTDPFRYKDRATPAAAYGDFVHKLLESVRFDEPDPAEIKQTVASVFLRMDIKSSAPEGEEDLSEEELKARHIDALSVMVENVLSAKPLAALPDFELKTLSESEKASEMDFLLSNNVGEANSGKTLTARQLSDALEMLDSEKYGGLRLNERQSLTGYLSGSIDLAFAAGGKFWIIDWKTNYLGDNAVDYRDEALEEAMQHKHYKLQYLLYLVALKRHLKLRFGFKDPYGSIGGAAYFFLRGVKAGSDRGVYFDRPDEAVIDCIDELLAKGWSVKTVEHYRKLMKNSKKGA
jgi:exodeoxyribonuclease V beta subunit